MCMLATKSLSSHILSMSHASAIVEASHHRGLVPVIDVAGHVRSARPVDTGRDSVSSCATDCAADFANGARGEPERGAHEPSVYNSPGETMSKYYETEEILQEMEAAEEEFIPGSPFADDLSDAVEMDLDNVVHVADCVGSDRADYILADDRSQSIQSFKLRRQYLYGGGPPTGEASPSDSLASGDKSATRPQKASKLIDGQPAPESDKPLARRDSESTERVRIGSTNSKPPSRDPQASDTYAKPSSRSSNAEPRQKQSKSKQSNAKMRDRDDASKTSKSGKVRTHLPPQLTPQNHSSTDDFDRLLESTVLSQTDAEVRPC